MASQAKRTKLLGVLSTLSLLVGFLCVSFLVVDIVLSNSVNVFRTIFITIFGILCLLIGSSSILGIIYEKRSLVYFARRIITYMLIVVSIFATIYLIFSHAYTIQLLQYSQKDYTSDWLVRNIWDILQKYGKCCGADGYNSWFTHGELQMNVPYSCCQSGCNKTSTCLTKDGNVIYEGLMCTSVSNLYKTGCFDSVLLLSTKIVIFSAFSIYAIIFYAIVWSLTRGEDSQKIVRDIITSDV